MGKGKRITELRVVCGSCSLIVSVKEKLGLSYDKLAKMLNVSKSTIMYYKKGGTLPLSVYRQLISYLGKPFPYEKLLDPYWGQRKGGLTSKERGRIPKLTSERARAMFRKSLAVRREKTRRLASFMAEKLIREKPTLLAEFTMRMLGDGSIKDTPAYLASEYESHLRFVDLVEKLFGFKPKIRREKSYFSTSLRRICRYVLNELGIPSGAKSVTNPHIPSFIMKHEDLSVIKSAILGFFDDEAYVSKRILEVGVAVKVDNAPIKQIHEIFGIKRSVGVKKLLQYFPEINFPKSNLIFDLSKLLDRLSISHKVVATHFNVNKGSLSITWKIIIYGKDNLQKIAKLGLLSLPSKVKKIYE